MLQIQFRICTSNEPEYQKKKSGQIIQIED